MAGPLPRTCPHDSMKKQEVCQEDVLRCVSFNKPEDRQKRFTKSEPNKDQENNLWDELTRHDH